MALAASNDVRARRRPFQHLRQPKICNEIFIIGALAEILNKMSASPNGKCFGMEAVSCRRGRCVCRRFIRANSVNMRATHRHVKITCDRIVPRSAIGKWAGRHTEKARVADVLILNVAEWARVATLL